MELGQACWGGALELMAPWAWTHRGVLGSGSIVGVDIELQFHPRLENRGVIGVWECLSLPLIFLLSEVERAYSKASTNFVGVW